MVVFVTTLTMLSASLWTLNTLAGNTVGAGALLCHAVIALEDKAWVAIDTHRLPLDKAEFTDRRFAVDTLAGVRLTLPVH